MERGKSRAATAAAFTPMGITPLLPWRLRLIHLDADTISDHLRPSSGPVSVEAGAFLGNLAPLDGCGHLHMSLTRLERGHEIPQPFSIDSHPLRDCGGEACCLGGHFPPQTPR